MLGYYLTMNAYLCICLLVLFERILPFGGRCKTDCVVVAVAATGTGTGTGTDTA